MKNNDGRLIIKPTASLLMEHIDDVAHALYAPETTKTDILHITGIVSVGPKHIVNNVSMAGNNLVKQICVFQNGQVNESLNVGSGKWNMSINDVDFNNR